MIDQRIIKHILWFVSFICAIKIVTLYKVSVWVAPYIVRFGLHNTLVPLSGLWGGFWGATVFCTFSLIVRIIAHGGTFPLYYLAYIIPGYCASLYWVSSRAIIRFYVPLICMILFMVHPVGFYAAPYALYWLIPLMCYISKSRSFFLQALSSTCIAHAVGSVIWLYTVPMTVEQWYTLIPLVALERLSFALGMVIVYNSVCYMKKTTVRMLSAAHARWSLRNI